MLAKDVTESPPAGFTYRHDIDGLRAIAVLPIVLFHAGYEEFAGGFVGVDIFFVISGFLITSIILRDLERERFSIRRFYTRRVRRIIPALTVVLVATLLVGSVVLLPLELTSLAQSSIATIAFVANIFYWRSSDYFSEDAASMPLLHTWSLGVEEQFYVFYPILLLVLTRLGALRGLPVALTGILGVSFGLSVYGVAQNYEVFTFYNLPTRAWELLAGAMIAFVPRRYQPGQTLAWLASVAGGTMLIWSIVVLTEDSPFPGLNALPPVLGASLLIYAGLSRQSPTSYVLTLPPLVFVGHISYSLYLWHWPVVVYGNMLWEGKASPVLLVGASFVLSVMSYYLVEQPVRRAGLSFSGRSAARLMVASCLLVATPSLFVLNTNGAAFRFEDRIVDIADPETHKARWDCHNRKPAKIRVGEVCTIGADEGPVTFALIGDSHAQVIRPALEGPAADHGFRGLFITANHCRPFLDVYNYPKRRCLDFTDAVFDLITNDGGVKTVFLANYWRVPYLGFGYRNKNYVIALDDSDEVGIENNPAVFEEGLRRTIRFLMGKGIDVVVIGDAPEVGGNPRTQYARRLALGKQGGTMVAEADEGIEAQLRRLVATSAEGARYVDIANAMCPGQRCLLNDGDDLIYLDGDHLSVYGAMKLTWLFEPFFDPADTGSRPVNSKTASPHHGNPR